ncbi:MAG: hypothetical protein IKJ33_04145 [Clostridia bacterium]|nr:hypothetical protein [Clostridia bacterium]
MKRFARKNELTKKEDVLSFIDFVKNIERKNGLGEEEIVQKYTHRDCRCLTSLINEVFPDTKQIMFCLDEEDFHFVASLDSKSKKGETITTYFDINGEKDFSSMCIFMFENFGKSGTIVSKETPKEFVSNDITSQVLDLIEFENFENEKQ